MKKILFIIIIGSITSLCHSQSINIQNAYSSYKQEIDGKKTKLSEAKYFIDLAYTNESTSNNPKMWNYRSKIYLEIMINNKDIDVDAVFKASEAHIRCLDRDKKGRIVVRKWTREEDIIDGLIQCGYALFNEAITDYTNGDYLKAIDKYSEIFKIIPIDKDNLLKRGNIVPDAIYKNLYLAAKGLENTEMQLEYLQKSIDNNTNDPLIYYYISTVYTSKKDFKTALKYIQEGKHIFSSEIILINSEIDLLMKLGSSSEEIITKLSEAIELDNSNEILYIIRSQQYSLVSNFSNAEKDLLEAIDINPESSSANNNIASLYLSMTEPIVKELNETSYTNSSKIKSLKFDIAELHKKVLPYLEKYLYLNEIEVKEGKSSYDKAALNTLATIYYGLNMESKSNELRNKLELMK